MSKPARLVFFGNERLASGVSTTAPILNWLIEAGYEVAALIINQNEAVSRQARVLEVAEVAAKYDIPILKISDFSDQEVEAIKQMGAVAGVLVAFGRIVPAKLIDVFPAGIINLHPSLLPKYRGPTPVETAILNGDSQTGVSIMALSEQMDAGPVYAQVALDLHGTDTKPELAKTLLAQGLELLKKSLGQILDGSLDALPQDDAAATYCRLLSKKDGGVDWQKPAEQIEREVRAYLGFPKSQAQLNGVDVILTRVRIAAGESDGVLVQKCGQGWLEIEELVGPSGRTMSGQDFINGYKI